MKLESSSFENGETIPKKFGYKNGNVSPSLIISDVPDSTKSLALIMDDPDAMGAVGKVWVHWVLWNIPTDIHQIDENSIPKNSIEGETDFGEIGYGGPAPPDKEHTYIFKLYAIDTVLDLSKGSTKKDLENSIQGHIIDETKLTGKYAPQ
ncbi:MAG: YbhB/YbcL family Raf kinase inhibitor-like protein [Nitrosopumilaceae archaeon]|nr:YbhB/YbcL family Raf kinase inhibitor-like protein [Nitrosopumilaceae archaeon]